MTTFTQFQKRFELPGRPPERTTMKHAPHIHWAGCPKQHIGLGALETGDMIVDRSDQLWTVDSVHVEGAGSMRHWIVRTHRYRGRRTRTFHYSWDATVTVVGPNHQR